MRKAIDFGALIGAQLTALIDAEVEGAEKTAEFIESVGFKKLADGKLELRTVTFDMEREDVDGVRRPHTIRIPVLTLVPIPLLTIEEANLEFELSVEDVMTIDGENDSDGQPPSRLGGRFGLPLKKRKLVTRLARNTTAKTSKKTTSKSDLKMSVKITQSDLPIGIERLINTADLSVEDSIDE